MGFDTAVKLAIYTSTADSGRIPSIKAVAQRVHASTDEVAQAYARLRAIRLLLLERDGTTIRMAPPFSGVPTQHHVVVAASSTLLTAHGTLSGFPQLFIVREWSTRGANKATNRSICLSLSLGLSLRRGSFIA